MLTFLATLLLLIGGIDDTGFNDASNNSSDRAQAQAEIPQSKIPVAEAPLSEFGATSANCGLYCLVAASAALKQEIDAKELLTGSFAPSNQGSTADDLVRAAEHYGLAAKRMDNGCLDALISLNRPIILQLNMGRVSRTYHWVTCIGKEDGQLLIVDAPNPPEKWSEAELLASWTKVAIVVSAVDDLESSAIYVYVMKALSLCAWVLWPILFAVIAIAIDRFWKDRGAKNGARLPTQVAVISLLAICGSFGISLAGVSHISLRSNHGELLCWLQSTDKEDHDVDNPINYIKTVSPSDFLIDARVRGDYLRGHVTNAYNLPISSNNHHYQNVVREIGNQQRVVVYCLSVRCAWAEMTCRRLRCMGIEAVVLAGGYQRYQTDLQKGELAR